jgi:hypothetical protein
VVAFWPLTAAFLALCEAAATLTPVPEEALRPLGYKSSESMTLEFFRLQSTGCDHQGTVYPRTRGAGA